MIHIDTLNKMIHKDTLNGTSRLIADDTYRYIKRYKEVDRW